MPFLILTFEPGVPQNLNLDVNRSSAFSNSLSIDCKVKSKLAIETEAAPWMCSLIEAVSVPVFSMTSFRWRPRKNCQQYGMLCHTLGRAVIFVSLLHSIAPALDLMPCLPYRQRREALKALNPRREK